MVSARAQRLRDESSERKGNNDQFKLVYSDAPYDLGMRNTDSVEVPEWTGEITLNIARSMVSAVSSKITKSRPLPSVVTTRGDWSLQRKGRDLAQYIDGDFERAGIFDTSARAFISCAIKDIGSVKTFVNPASHEVVTEVVDADDIFVDAEDGASGRPRERCQIARYDRELLMRTYPKLARDIEKSRAATETKDGRTNHLVDLVEVYELWRLPSYEGAGDGRVVLCTDKVTLHDDEWPWPWFPFCDIRWSDEPDSFFGRSLVSELMPVQGEINRLAAHIQEAFHMGANWYWAIENGADITRQQLGNVNAVVIRYNKIPPQRIVNNVVPEQLFAHLDRLWARSFDIAGVSELAVAARKPAGLDSGKALRTFHDIGTERFARIAQQWERLHLEIAKQRVALARELQKEGYTPKVVYSSQRWQREIELPDLDAEAYSLKVTPVSSFSTSLPGKIAEIEHLVALGVVNDPVQVRRLLQMPDLESDDETETAMRELAEHVVERILDDGEAIVCEPEWDAALLKRVAKLHLARAFLHGAPPAHRQLLRDFIASCNFVLAAGGPPVAGPSVGAPANDVSPPITPGAETAPMPMEMLS